MGPFEIIAVLITLAALLAYVNHRFLRMPQTVGLMLLSLAVAAVLLGLGQIGGDVGRSVQNAARSLMREKIDFPAVLLHGMLSLLLFAGALHVRLEDLLESKWSISILATLGVVGSTFVVGGMVFGLSAWLGLGLGWIFCLLFGALISPTDPVAVMAILKKAGVPKTLETKIAGESLFNDGIGVVVFLSVLDIATGARSATVAGIAKLFLAEVLGGVALGLVLGYLAYRLLKSVDNYQVEVLITLALALGGYALAHAIHTSGPLAMVAAGLLIGNRRHLAMSARTREHLGEFWELIDEILNAVLFVMIGLEVLVLTLSGRYLLAGVLAIPLVLLARLATVGVPMRLLALRRRFAPRAIRILTWGGLRGGISVALALSLPHDTKEQTDARDLILTMTYVVVAFSICVQGLTVGKLVTREMRTSRVSDGASEV